jgi:hypothetical protein
MFTWQTSDTTSLGIGSAPGEYQRVGPDRVGKARLIVCSDGAVKYYDEGDQLVSNRLMSTLKRHIEQHGPNSACKRIAPPPRSAAPGSSSTRPRCCAGTASWSPSAGRILRRRPWRVIGSEMLSGLVNSAAG